MCMLSLSLYLHLSQDMILMIMSWLLFWHLSFIFSWMMCFEKTKAKSKERSNHFSAKTEFTHTYLTHYWHCMHLLNSFFIFFFLLPQLSQPTWIRPNPWNAYALTCLLFLFLQLKIHSCKLFHSCKAYFLKRSKLCRKYTLISRFFLQIIRIISKCTGMRE